MNNTLSSLLTGVLFFAFSFFFNPQTTAAQTPDTVKPEWPEPTWLYRLQGITTHKKNGDRKTNKMAFDGRLRWNAYDEVWTGNVFFQTPPNRESWQQVTVNYDGRAWSVSFDYMPGFIVLDTASLPVDIPKPANRVGVDFYSLLWAKGAAPLPKKLERVDDPTRYKPWRRTELAVANPGMSGGRLTINALVFRMGPGALSLALMQDGGGKFAGDLRLPVVGKRNAVTLYGGIAAYFGGSRSENREAAFYGSGGLAELQFSPRNLRWLHAIRMQQQVLYGKEVVSNRLQSGWEKTFSGATFVPITSAEVILAPFKKVDWVAFRVAGSYGDPMNGETKLGCEAGLVFSLREEMPQRAILPWEKK